MEKIGYKVLLNLFQIMAFIKISICRDNCLWASYIGHTHLSPRNERMKVLSFTAWMCFRIYPLGSSGEGGGGHWYLSIRQGVAKIELQFFHTFVFGLNFVIFFFKREHFMNIWKGEIIWFPVLVSLPSNHLYFKIR